MNIPVRTSIRSLLERSGRTHVNPIQLHPPFAPSSCTASCLHPSAAPNPWYHLPSCCSSRASNNPTAQPVDHRNAAYGIKLASVPKPQGPTPLPTLLTPPRCLPSRSWPLPGLPLLASPWPRARPRAPSCLRAPSAKTLFYASHASRSLILQSIHALGDRPSYSTTSPLCQPFRPHSWPQGKK